MKFLGILVALGIVAFIFFFTFKLKKNRRKKWRKAEYEYEYENLTIDQKFNASKVDKQKELDRILDKISDKGYERLSNNEKSFLEEFGSK